MDVWIVSQSVPNRMSQWETHSYLRYKNDPIHNLKLKLSLWLNMHHATMTYSSTYYLRH